MPTTRHNLNMGDLGEWNVEIEYKYTPATPDVMYLRNGDPGHPGDPAEISLISVKGMPSVEELEARLAEFLQLDDDFYEKADAIHREARYGSED